MHSSPSSFSRSSLPPSLRPYLHSTLKALYSHRCSPLLPLSNPNPNPASPCCLVPLEGLLLLSISSDSSSPTASLLLFFSHFVIHSLFLLGWVWSLKEISLEMNLELEGEEMMAGKENR